MSSQEDIYILVKVCKRHITRVSIVVKEGEEGTSEYCLCPRAQCVMDENQAADSYPRRN